MKRAVRRRCGFGCVLCGVPIYQIDHIVDYSQVQRHEEENLTLLCPTHHQDKTHGRMSVETVSAANADPVNLRAGVTPPHTLYFGSGPPEIEMGRNWFRWTRGGYLVALAVDNLTLVGFRQEEGGLLLALLVLDEYNLPLLQVVDSELQIASAQWDVEITGPRIILRQGPGDIILQLLLQPPSKVTVERARFRCNGVIIEAGTEGLFVNGENVGLGNAYETPVGYAIGRRDRFPSVGCRIPRVLRYQALRAGSDQAGNGAGGG